MNAAELRALRKRLGMTREQLADALDLSIDTINNYEGARGPYQIPRVVELAIREVERASQRDTQTPGKTDIPD
jgi:transcriptional regulator with XRE-family HTH domain